MPRASKGPRLYAMPERRDPRTGALIEQSVWVIRDGPVKRSTGVGVTDRRKPPEAAKDALGKYLTQRHTASRERERDAASVAVADVIAIYLTDKVNEQARPREVAGRARRLLEWWGDKTLSHVTGSNCRAYVAHRGNSGGARRELEDLRAAIKYHRAEGLCREVVEVVLPEKGSPRERWLTRSEAARLIWAAWRYREVQKGKPTGRKSRQHVARFILVALYTGTRAGAVCAAALQPMEGAGWINLESGVFYRRPKGERETKKRKPPVRLPGRLLAHLKRWHGKGLSKRYVVEWNGRPVSDVDKAFRNSVKAAGLSSDVTPHVLKHTSITWSMQAGTSLSDAASFYGTTVETMEQHYWHHHPDFQIDAAENVARNPARSPRQNPGRNDRNKREQTGSEETNVVDFSKVS